VTTYFTTVADDLLGELRSGDTLPARLRLVREVGAVGSGRTLVEFDDDDAPVELSGRTVTPFFQVHYDDRGHRTHSTVLRRKVDSCP
jgi:hypothetical protein